MKSKEEVTAVEGETKPALVPKLRFPEFRSAQGWEPKKLAEICHLITNGRANAQDHEENGKYPLFDRSSVIKKSNDFFFDTEAVILPGEGMRFVPKYFRGKFNLHQRAYALMRHQGDGRFVYHSLDYFQDILAERAVKSTVLSLRLPIVENFVIGCPKVAEQQKIADCLSSLDELIAAQARKVDALKTHKNGLMQQLFPREGETQPRLRFSDFKCASHWRRETIGSVASFSSGGTPSKANPEYWNGSIPWVSASSMYDLVIDKADHYVTPAAIGNGTKIAKKGSVLILVRGSMLFKRVPICIAGVDVAFNQDVKALDVDASINANFLLYQLLAFQDRLSINETGIGAGKIELDHLKGFVLFIPDSPEQQHIASFLTSLDALIADETQKLEALKTHKKGLMQQLFPSPDEATA